MFLKEINEIYIHTDLHCCDSAVFQKQNIKTKTSKTKNAGGALRKLEKKKKNIPPALPGGVSIVKQHTCPCWLCSVRTNQPLCHCTVLSALTSISSAMATVGA